MKPQVGTPATIVLYTDTIAAVVVKVNEKSVVVREVEVGPERNLRGPGYPFPLISADGLLDRPVGPEQNFRLGRDGHYHRGSVDLVLGKSVKRTDYAV
jgi:hypothetical protein